MAMHVKEIWSPDQREEIQVRSVKEGLEVVVVTISMQKPARVVTLIGIYRSPTALASWFQKLDNLLIEAMAKGLLVILGDLNSLNSVFDLNSPLETGSRAKKAS